MITKTVGKKDPLEIALIKQTRSKSNNLIAFCCWGDGGGESGVRMICTDKVNTLTI